MPTSRFLPASGVVNNYVYVVGGYNNGFLSTAEGYAP